MGIPVVVSQTPPAGDLANAVLTGSFTATGNGLPFEVYGDFNFAIYGTFSGTVTLQKTFDGGTNWIPVAFNNSGTAVSFTTPLATTIGETERGVVWRAECSAFTSGTINYRFSASGMMAQSAGAETV